MKVLIVSNMYPSKEKTYAGIFVKNQFEELKQIFGKEDSIEIFYMKREFTSKRGSVVKYIKAFFNFIPFLFKKYDVVHLHFFHPLIYLVWLYKKLHPRTKIVVTFHGSDVNIKINDKNKKHLIKFSKCIDFVIPVGKQLSVNLREKLNLNADRVLSVGVNNRIFYKEIAVHKKYDFIFVGSFYSVKGLDTIIEAIRLLNNKNISFCFCGSGEYLSLLESLKKEGFNITIKQNQTQPELRRLLNQSRFFLIMSRNEGFPTATMEAMYCGVPVVTSDIPQFKEQVKEGYNGYIVPLENFKTLAQKINSLKKICHKDYDMLCEGAQNSFKELSLQNVCKELYAIYKQLIA